MEALTLYLKKIFLLINLCEIPAVCEQTCVYLQMYLITDRLMVISSITLYK